MISCFSITGFWLKQLLGAPACSLLGPWGAASPLCLAKQPRKGDVSPSTPTIFSTVYPLQYAWQVNRFSKRGLSPVKVNREVAAELSLIAGPLKEVRLWSSVRLEQVEERYSHSVLSSLSEHGVSVVTFSPHSALSVRLHSSCPVPTGSLQQGCPLLAVVCDCRSHRLVMKQVLWKFFLVLQVYFFSWQRVTSKHLSWSPQDLFSTLTQCRHLPVDFLLWVFSIFLWLLASNITRAGSDSFPCLFFSPHFSRLTRIFCKVIPEAIWRDFFTSHCFPPRNCFRHQTHCIRATVKVGLLGSFTWAPFLLWELL